MSNLLIDAIMIQRQRHTIRYLPGSHQLSKNGSTVGNGLELTSISIPLSAPTRIKSAMADVIQLLWSLLTWADTKRNFGNWYFPQDLMTVDSPLMMNMLRRKRPGFRFLMPTLVLLREYAVE
jgi:hypothetical protein